MPGALPVSVAPLFLKRRRSALCGGMPREPGQAERSSPKRFIPCSQDTESSRWTGAPQLFQPANREAHISLVSSFQSRVLPQEIWADVHERSEGTRSPFCILMPSFLFLEPQAKWADLVPQHQAEARISLVPGFRFGTRVAQAPSLVINSSLLLIPSGILSAKNSFVASNCCL